MCIIKPALLDLQLFSDDAVELLAFTAAVESEGGTYLKQIEGPALGIYQMEPETHNDIWQNYIKHKTDIYLMLIHNFNVNGMPHEERLMYDLRYATALARIHYSRISQPLPHHTDLIGIWNYYKKYYNTVEGAANQQRSLAAYQKFIKA